tara:strand:- start:1848 stop:2990 length:1143 start_codon:yes stop_codon:yes gene_type:complete
MRPRKVSASGSQDVVIFGCAFLFGAAGILVSKYLLELHQIMVTIVPVAIMLLYALYLATSQQRRVRDDQAGDNLYYLGFLYTLCSLAIALWDASATDQMTDIISSFGIAIATTIVGITLRVMFVQLRYDPIDVERVSRLELSAMARRVRTELEQTTKEFISFRRVMLQQIQEGEIEFRDKIHEALEETVQKGLTVVTEAREEFQRHVETQLAALSEAQRSLHEGFVRLDEASSETTTTFRSRSGALAKSFERLTGTLEDSDHRLQQSVDQGTERLASVLSTSSSQTLAAATEFSERLRTTGATIATAGDITDRFAQQLQEMSAGVTALTSAIGTQSNTAANVEAQLSLVSESLSKVLGHLEDQLEASQSTKKRLRRWWQP